MSVYTPDYEHVGGSCTQDGQWAIPEIPDGTYRVRVDGDNGYVGEWAQDSATLEEASDVTAPGTVGVTLTLGGVLAGTLTDAEGAPVAGASVAAYEAVGEVPVEFGSTDEAGNWRLIVRPGSYKVQMSNWPAVVWAFGASSHELATTLDVRADATVRVDDHFKAAAMVTGRITEARTKRPVAGACATLVSLTGYDDGQEFGRGCADETGAYELTAWAEGSFLVLFTDPSGSLAAEYSGGTTNPLRAKPVAVVAGRTVTASTALDAGGVLTGRVVDVTTGEGIPDVCPSAHIGRTWSWVPGQNPTCSDDQGRYRIGGLPADATTLLLAPQWDSGLAQTWYLGATDVETATLLRPRAGRVTTLSDTRLAQSGAVTGVVTDGLGNPVPNVHVNLMGSYGGRAGGCESPVCGYTDELGRYTIKAPPGTYTPFFWSYEGGWAPEWSGDASTKSAAAPVTVTSGTETALDAILEQGGQITGTVVNADGSQPSQYALGLVFTEDGDYIGDFDAYSGSDYTFRSSSLPSGTFRLKVQLYDEATGTSTDSWYDGATTEAGATLVSLSQGEVRDLTYRLP